MSAVDRDRPVRVGQLCDALVDAAPGSTCVPTGSIARGTDDLYSDIDLHWRVGQAAPSVAADLLQILSRVAPVVSLRWDQSGAATRLAFIRFNGWPLFSRLDLQITGDFQDAPVVGDPWTDTESALMNVIGAIKSHLRGSSEFEGLINRGFQRIHVTDPGGPPTRRMQSLVDASLRLNPAMKPLADEITCALQDLVA